MTMVSASLCMKLLPVPMNVGVNVPQMELILSLLDSIMPAPCLMAVLRANAFVSSPTDIFQADSAILVKAPVQMTLADPPGLWLVLIGLVGWRGGLVQLLGLTGTQAWNATSTTTLS